MKGAQRVPFTLKTVDRIRQAHSAGKRTVTLQGVKFKLALDKTKTHIHVTPANGDTLPLGNIRRHEVRR